MSCWFAPLQSTFPRPARIATSPREGVLAPYTQRQPDLVGSSQRGPLWLWEREVPGPDKVRPLTYSSARKALLAASPDNRRGLNAGLISPLCEGVPGRAKQNNFYRHSGNIRDSDFEHLKLLPTDPSWALTFVVIDKLIFTWHWSVMCTYGSGPCVHAAERLLRGEWLTMQTPFLYSEEKMKAGDFLYHLTLSFHPAFWVVNGFFSCIRASFIFWVALTVCRDTTVRRLLSLNLDAKTQIVQLLPWFHNFVLIKSRLMCSFIHWNCLLSLRVYTARSFPSDFNDAVKSDSIFLVRETSISDNVISSIPSLFFHICNHGYHIVFYV